MNRGLGMRRPKSMLTVYRIGFCCALWLGGVVAWAQPAGDTLPDLRWFLQAADPDDEVAEPALERLASVWRDAYTPMIVDMARFMRAAPRPGPGGFDDISAGFPGRAPDEDPGGVGPIGGDPALGRPGPSGRPGSPIRARLIRFLERQTGQRFGDDLDRWREWMWTLPYAPHPGYQAFKGFIYGQIDPRMRDFFGASRPPLIRLDEIDWGGVPVNGIPPLVYPVHVRAEDADYLKGDHLVFGIEVGGEVRAYPKRILAWHELARDRLGGIELTIVYCTLCGTVIPYESDVGGRLRTFGTSGLLYRSNKLMFDEETSSLWSTLEGRPVVGPLAGEPLQLRFRSVVTTTWDEWRTMHPETTVLSIETGFDRDYREGAAYREYFRTDRLMFQVSRTDGRLKNKDEVLVMKLTPPGAPDAVPQPVAIATKRLQREPVYQAELAGRALVVVTSREGASRAYETGGRRFVERTRAGLVREDGGSLWRVTEEALVSQSEPSVSLPRIPAHRAFWFGWFAQYPETLLIQ